MQAEKFTVSSAVEASMWQPRYGTYSLSAMLHQLEDIENWARHSRTDGSRQLAASEAFIRRAFDQYHGRADEKKHYGFVFSAPTRIQRGTDQFATEAAHFLPIVTMMDSHTRQMFISNLPPCVVDEYGDPSNPHGAVIFIPLFADILHDVSGNIAKLRLVNKVLDDSAAYISTKFDTEIMGLGAILPKLSKFGQAFTRRGIAVTTGHAGTTWLILASLQKAIQENIVPQPLTIGFVGLGAIGEASARLVLQQYPEARAFAHDFRTRHQEKVVKHLNDHFENRVYPCQSNNEVLRRSSVIISAVTAKIQVKNLDLAGKLIIDDSQPSSFDASSVERQGGKLVWVVGHDSSRDHFVTRDSGYRFGEEGLMEHGDVWGCEAEVATLWKTGRTQLAVARPVKSEDTKRIGEVMKQAGITVAHWQQHGQDVELAPLGRASA